MKKLGLLIVIALFFSVQGIAQKQTVKITYGKDCSHFGGRSVFLESFSKTKEYICMVKKTRINPQTNEVYKRETLKLTLYPKDRISLGCQKDRETLIIFKLLSKKIIGKYND